MFDHCMYFNTTALARRLEREWAEAFAPFGLTPPQGFLLRAVLEKPGLLQSELADAMAIARATATRAVDGLVRMDLVERRPGTTDRREVTVHPTAAGLEMRKPLNDASGAVTRRLKRLLGDDVFAATVGHVKNVHAALR